LLLFKSIFRATFCFNFIYLYTYLLFSLLFFASSFDMKCNFYRYFTVAFSGEKIKTVSEIFKSYFHLSTEQIV